MNLNICQSDLAFLGDDDLRRVLKDIKAFGFKKVRWEVPFHVVYAKKGANNWSSVVRVLDALEDVGLDHLPVLGAKKALMSWSPSEQDYADFCVASIAFMDGITEVELWNEPNLIQFWPKADPASFYLWIQTAYDAIHYAYSAIKTIHGGLAASQESLTGIWKFLRAATGYNRRASDFLAAELVSANGKKFFDKMGYHPYATNDMKNLVDPGLNPFGMNELSHVRAKAPDVETVITEFGFNGNGNLIQLQWLSKQLTRMKGFEMYLYCWRDCGGETFGLVDRNNKPKKPYYDFVKTVVI